jgi:hypothetical protein
MDYFEKIKKDLPNFPDDVVEQFLLPYAKKLGWPPENCKNDSNNRWKNILRSNDLAYWRQVGWNKEILKLSPHELLSKDYKIVVDLMRTNVQVQDTFYRIMLDSKERFDRICLHLKQESVYPRTVAIERIGGKYRILDGCHRLSAYFYLCGWFNIEDDTVPCLGVKDEQEYWVGKRELEKDSSAE